MELFPGGVSLFYSVVFFSCRTGPPPSTGQGRTVKKNRPGRKVNSAVAGFCLSFLSFLSFFLSSIIYIYIYSRVITLLCCSSRIRSSRRLSDWSSPLRSGGRDGWRDWGGFPVCVCVCMYVCMYAKKKKKKEPCPVLVITVSVPATPCSARRHSPPGLLLRPVQGQV